LAASRKSRSVFGTPHNIAITVGNHRVLTIDAHFSVASMTFKDKHALRQAFVRRIRMRRAELDMSQ
jgi:hypothetical protein